MLDIFSGLRLVIKRRHTNIDNAIFRCHWFLTSTILVSFSLIITARQYVGQPIECHSVNKISDSLLNSYCWVQSTFTIPQACGQRIGLDVPYPCIDNTRGREIKVFAYYQWVGIVLFVQGVLFHLPYYLWKVWESGLIKAITGGLRVAVCGESERRRKRDIVVEYIYEHLGCHRKYAIKYFICELCCLLNLILQLWATNKFFDGQFLSYGLDVMQYSSSTSASATAPASASASASNPSSTTNANAATNNVIKATTYAQRSQTSPRSTSSSAPTLVDPMIFIFPRMTKCTYYDFGSSGDVQKHDALCLLPLNIVNEKIYIALWFWFIVLALLTLLVIIYRICAFASRSVRCKGLASRCKFSSVREIETICATCDIGDWFLLYMVAENLDPLVMREIVAAVAFRLRFDAKLAAAKPLDFEAVDETDKTGKEHQDLRLLLSDSRRPSLASSTSCAEPLPTYASVGAANIFGLMPAAPPVYARRLRKRLYGRRQWSVDLASLRNIPGYATSTPSAPAPPVTPMSPQHSHSTTSSPMSANFDNSTAAPSSEPATPVLAGTEATGGQLCSRRHAFETTLSG